MPSGDLSLNEVCYSVNCSVRRDVIEKYEAAD